VSNAQFYASLKTGHVTASVALKRLVGFSAKNRFYRANRDLGHIFEIEFILQYLSEPQLRRRIRRFAQGRATPRLGQGRLLRAARPDQRPRAVGADEHVRCLNLILACIVYLQAVRNLPGPECVRPDRLRNASLPAGTYQPHRLG
jgi:Tn3 transposase DDE domain